MEKNKGNEYLERENDNLEEGLKFSDDDVSVICKNCGGPLPSCEPGCKMSDN